MNLGNLGVFYFDGQSLCAPLDAAFQAWLQAIPDSRGTNCEDEGLQADFDALKALYQSTDGDNWDTNTNWDLTRVPTAAELAEWHGVTVDGGQTDRTELAEQQLGGPAASSPGQPDPVGGA